jgi:hypothetical protein
MSKNKTLILELESLLHRKKSKAYYAEKLGIREEEIKELLTEISLKNKLDLYKPLERKPQKNTRKVNKEKGTIESTIVSDFEPKNDLELAELHKINLDKYVITNYWSKVLPNGKFTSSIFSKLISEDEIIRKDLTKDIKEIFSKTEKFSGKVKYQESDKALFVYIADDHTGIVLKDSLFGNPYTGDIYQDRLKELAKQIISLDYVIDTLFIVNLGDELDGFNKQTTRGGHALESLSNKEQFDIYTSARKMFYDTILTSNLFQEITIININNSNHSGNDYSYIVNKSLEFYLDARYDNITIINQDKFIDSYIWGDHTILFTHGKDEKYMKFGFPLNLNEKVDLWLLDYSKNLKSKYMSTIKGDLHAYSVNIGKSGRYINVPSICGGSNWIEHNYGSSNAGALLEIVDKTDKNIISIPIWF